MDENRSFVQDIYSKVNEKDNNWTDFVNSSQYVRVTFEIPLNNSRDITLFARSENVSSIDVYVKEIDNNTYYQYKEVESLYLSNSTDRVYERRLNENGFFEIKFGSGVFGRK